MKHFKKLTYIPVAVLLAGCGNTLDRLGEVGQEPTMHTVSNPVKTASYRPLESWPTPIEPEFRPKAPNSLWEQGSRAFFKDQRANRVGDILTVMINIDDKADLTNGSNRSRTTTETMAAPRLGGLEEKLLKLLPGNPDLDNFLSMNGNNSNNGTGTIGREETIELKLAAIITQVLPNGNLRIHGTQEIRVNYELRQLQIDGVIRPQDISSDNTIPSEQIAEARVSYGGKGHLSDVQQPRIGSQVIDILSPF